MVKSVSLIKSTKQFTQQKNKIKYAFARDLISSYSVLTKEDYYAVKSLQDKYKGLTSENIAQKIAENFNFIINSFQSFFSDTKMVGQLLIYNAQEKVTKRLIDRIKQFNLQKLALSTLKSLDNSKTITIPSANIKYTLSSANQKQLPVSTQESLLSHPVDIAQNIIGHQDFNSSVNNNNLKLYKKKSPKDLLKMQFEILTAISKYIANKGNKQNFVYTKQEMKELKSLVTKYLLVNKILNIRNINIKNIETLFFHPLMPEDIRIGDTLPNSDIVIDKVKIYDLEEQKNISSIMTFANTNSGYRLKTYKYDEELFKRINKLKKQYQMYLNQNNIDKLKLLGTQCAKFVNNSEIAEVFFQEKNRDEITAILSETNLLSKEKIEEILQAGQQFLFIRNLKNYNLKKYHNVSLPLIKNLKAIIDNNKNLGMTFINALAYNNVKHSPALLYLRAGCKPISHTADEIRQMLKKPSETFEQPVLFLYNASLS